MDRAETLARNFYEKKIGARRAEWRHSPHRWDQLFDSARFQNINHARAFIESLATVPDDDAALLEAYCKAHGLG